MPHNLLILGGKLAAQRKCIALTCENFIGSISSVFLQKSDHGIKSQSASGIPGFWLAPDLGTGDLVTKEMLNILR